MPVPRSILLVRVGWEGEICVNIQKEKEESKYVVGDSLSSSLHHGRGCQATAGPTCSAPAQLPHG